MKKETFKLIWDREFPEADPIGYELKWIYKNRWFRIHSLPASKRLAATQEEYETILHRQNEIIDDLVGAGTLVILLLGRYEEIPKEDHYLEETEFGAFLKVDTIDLHQTRPKQYERGLHYGIYIRELLWRRNTINHLLKLIADDEERAMIIYPEKNRIISPYDGGVDVIMESERSRDYYKEKYRSWLSAHSEGL